MSRRRLHVENVLTSVWGVLLSSVIDNYRYTVDMPSTSPRTADSSRSLARHRVRDLVQQLILSGQYQPGQRLVQQELAARFGVAQSVVRESLLELQFCGLVEAVDNLGMSVAGLGGQAILEAYQIREVLEGLSARLCCETASRAEIRELRQLAEQFQQSVGRLTPQALSGLDRQFHHRIILASQNRLLVRLTESYRVLGMFVRAYRDRDEVHREHLEVVAAIEGNRPDEAESLARRHVQAARESIQRQLAEGTFVPQTVEEPAAEEHTQSRSKS
jgi:DNA-binding GntR family transcriptional regulator